MGDGKSEKEAARKDDVWKGVTLASAGLGEAIVEGERSNERSAVAEPESVTTGLAEVTPLGELVELNENTNWVAVAHVE